MATTADIPALMAHLAKALVDAPDEVEAEAFDEGGQVVVELVVAEEEVGKIIGRQGRMARSLRTIMTAAALKTRKRYQLEIVEELHSSPSRAYWGRKAGAAKLPPSCTPAFLSVLPSAASFQGWPKTAAVASCSLKSTGSTRDTWC